MKIILLLVLMVSIVAVAFLPAEAQRANLEATD